MNYTDNRPTGRTVILGREFLTEFDPRDLAMRPDPDEARELPLPHDRPYTIRRRARTVMDRRWR